MHASWTRRQLLRTTAALTAAGATVAGMTAAAPPVSARGAANPPAGFPPDIELYRSAYRNWSGETTATGLWACAPRDTAQVVAAVNWAYRSGWRVRPRGHSHGWAPLTLAADSGGDAGSGRPVLLLDTTRHLTGLDISAPPGGPASVRAGTGVSMEELLTSLEEHGLGLTAAPAPGDLSLGGVLAIDAHGTAVPGRGESRPSGQTYGSLSNRVVSLTAVVWDPGSGAYTARTYRRDDPDCAVLLAHLGRALITEAVLRVGENDNLRCVSRTDIPAEELFAPPGGGGRTFGSFVAETGRAEAIWFAFSEHPWLKVWSVAPERPPASRPVTRPYNYPFSDNVPRPVAELAGKIVSEGAWYLAPALGEAQSAASATGLVATAAADLWGPSKNTLLYIRPTTLRVTANGYAVVTARSRVQEVVAAFTAFYRERLAAYAARGRFPVNGSVEIRVTGLDRPEEAGVPGAVAPALSALRPVPDRPEWDTAVWLDVLTLPGTPDAPAFYRELERFLLRAFDGTTALTRVEWSKGWAYTDRAAWDDPEVIGEAVPASLPGWDGAVAALDRLDPHRVFGNPFLDRLLA
ncbi:FAD-linked oxidase [Streptomyces carminius]|uniref:FAD-linked oxidase n=1 Tax=Streptomyces carminius TaxID=2665496 RepID=A0A2M8M0V5_9ACTN|nr:cholesterol oxidase substrate-binding domain-containing protein [Streptomyces carminius]PJE97844.1 FAD-linked oxidase [Streptomyces carminius]